MNTICLLMSDKKHQRLLKELLIEHYSIIDASTGVPSEFFDLCITDSMLLDILEEQFRYRKESATEYFSVLLSISDIPENLFSRSWWEIVDDVVERNIHKSFLLLRIQSLIRISNLKKELNEKNKCFFDKNVFNTILQHLPLNLMVVKYPDAKIIAISGNLRRFAGDVEGKSAYQVAMEAGFHQPGKAPPDKNSLPVYRAMENKELVENEEWVLESEGKGKQFVQINASPVFDNSGNVKGAIMIGLDITRHIQLLNELSTKSQLFETLIENIPVMINIYDSKMNITYVNQTFEKLTGWNRSVLKNSNILKLMYPDNRYREMVIKCMKNQSSGYSDFKMKISNGTILESSWAFIKIPDNRLVGIGIDITKRKRMENELQKTREKYRILFDSIDEAYCIIKVIFDNHNNPCDFQFLEVNSSFSRQTGIKNPVGRSMREIEPLHEKEWFEKFGKVALDGKPLRFVMQAKKLNRWHDVYAFRFGEPQNRQVAVVFNNITKRIAFERALKESEERFHTLADNISQLAWMANPKGEIFWFNKRWFEFTGTNLETMKKDGLQRIIHADHLERVLSSFHKAIQNGVPWEDTFLMRRSDNQFCWFLTRAMPIRDKTGSIIRWFGTNTDISEIKKAQEQQSISAERFHRIISSRIIGICISDLEGNIIHANDYFLNTIGYSRHDLDNHVITWEKITPPEYYAIDIKSFEEMQRTGTITPYEKEYVRKDGSRVWIHLAATFLPGPQRQVLVFALDVTERKQALIEAQKRRAEIEAILRSFPDGYIIYDQNGHIRQINDMAEKITGLSPGNSYPVKDNKLKMMSADGKPFSLENTPSFRTLQGEIIHNEIICIKRPDQEYWVSVSTSPISANGQSGAIVGFSDITRLYKLQKQLTDERNFVDAVFETAGALITVTDKDSLFIRFNRACEKLTGYLSNEVIGQSMFTLFIPKEEWNIVEDVRRRLLDGETNIAYENHWLTRSGDQRFIRWQSSTLSDESGNVVFIITTGIDISDRKKLQEELSASNRDLESFSYSISHDLRGPLGIINGLTDILCEDYCNVLDKEARDYLLHVKDNVVKMQNLITSLLNLSRVERHEIKRVNLNLSQIANNIIQELCSREPERKTELNVKADVFAFADAHLIQLALENLLRNAWKFTSKKEITRIEFGYNLQNNKKVYFIKDNGAGFDMQFAQKIFQPFQRLHKEKEFSGTGIGLSIVYRVINRHNGKIWATGEKNKGATFFFTLD